MDEYAIYLMLMTAWRGQALYVAVKLGIFDALSNGPKPLAELAVGGVSAIPHALVQIGLLARDGDVYSLTKDSALFVSSSNS